MKKYISQLVFGIGIASLLIGFFCYFRVPLSKNINWFLFSGIATLMAHDILYDFFEREGMMMILQVISILLKGLSIYFVITCNFNFLIIVLIIAFILDFLKPLFLYYKNKQEVVRK